MKAIIRAMLVSLVLLLVADALSIGNATPAEAWGKRKKLAASLTQMQYSELAPALVEAKTQNKQVLVLIATEWCPHCRALEQGIIPLPEVQDYLTKNFITVRVDGDKPYAAILKKQYPFEGVPTMMIFTPEGQLVNQMSGEPKSAEAFIGSLSALARRIDVPAPEPTF
jgi:thiol:disulfide interchange protein